MYVVKGYGKFKGRPAKLDNSKIVQVVDEGNSIAQTAKILCVAQSSVQRAKRTRV